MTSHSSAPRIIVAVLFLSLSACVTTPPRDPVANPEAVWKTRVSELIGIESWEVKGKLAVKTQKRGGQATMIWDREAEDHNINLYGPLGGGRVVLTRDHNGAVLRDSKKQTYYAKTTEELLYRVAGWRVPFESMRYWVLGVPAPGLVSADSIDKWGRLHTLHQGGWEIEFQQYRDFQGRDLPRKFVMRAAAGVEHIVTDTDNENPHVQVKVIIKRWRF